MVTTEMSVDATFCKPLLFPEQGHFRLRDESLAGFCDLLSCQDRSSRLTVTPPVLYLHSISCPRLQPGLLEGSHPLLL